MSVQNLKPTIDEIKRLYGEDKDKVQRETSELYKTSGVNPLAGTAYMHAAAAAADAEQPQSALHSCLMSLHAAAC